MTPALRRLVTGDADDAKIRDQAYKEGMKPLRVSGAMKVAAGLTTADEVVSRTARLVAYETGSFAVSRLRTQISRHKRLRCSQRGSASPSANETNVLRHFGCEMRRCINL